MCLSLFIICSWRKFHPTTKIGRFLGVFLISFSFLVSRALLKCDIKLSPSSAFTCGSAHSAAMSDARMTRAESGSEYELENSSFLFLGGSTNRALASSKDELHLQHQHSFPADTSLSQSIERISPKSPQRASRDGDVGVVLDPCEGSSESASFLLESSYVASEEKSSSLPRFSPSFVPTSRRKKKQGTNIILNYKQLQKMSVTNPNHRISLVDGESSTSPSRYSDSSSSSINNSSFTSPSRVAADTTTQSIVRSTPPSRSKLLRDFKSLNFMSDQVAAVEKRVAQKKASAATIQRVWRGFSNVTSLNAKALDKLVELDPTLARFFRSHHDESIYYSVNHSKYSRSAKMQRLQRLLGSIDKLSSWWRRVVDRRARRYVMNGKWTTSQADKVFAAVLGWRVRLLLRSEGARAIVSSIDDIIRVVADVADPSASSRGHNMRAVVEVISKSVAAGNELFSYPSLSSSDVMFIQKLLKQLQLNRKKFHSLFFTGSRFRSFPKPGFVDIGNAITSLLRHTGSAAGSKGFVARDGKIVAHTSPPTFKTRKQSLPLKKDKPAVSVFSFSGHRGPAADMGERVKKDISLSPEKKSMISSLRKVQLSSAQLGTPTVNPPFASEQSTPPSRDASRAFVYLQVASAANLMPARRGAGGGSAARVADRKPGLRIGLHLPSEPNGQSRKINAAAADWDDPSIAHTLDPTWNKSFSLPLPCPRGVLQAAVDGAADTGAAYKAACDALLDFWASGFLSIQVVDGERFNQEIFLGEVTLLLSAFLVKRNSREVSGTFPLSKQQVADRVSGSLLLKAQLQLPDESIIADLMQKRSAVKARSDISQSPIDFSSPPVTEAKNGNISSSVNRKIQILDVVKCLDGLSKVQKHTGILLGKMNNELEARKLARGALSDGGAASSISPASHHSLTCKVSEDASASSDADYSSNFVDESSPSVSVFDDTFGDIYSSIDFNSLSARGGDVDDDDVVVVSVREKRVVPNSLLSKIHSSAERLAAAMADMSAASIAENDDTVLQHDDDDDELLVDCSLDIKETKA